MEVWVYFFLEILVSLEGVRGFRLVFELKTPLVNSKVNTHTCSYKCKYPKWVTSPAPTGREDNAMKAYDITQLGCLHLHEHTCVYLPWVTFLACLCVHCCAQSHFAPSGLVSGWWVLDNTKSLKILWKNVESKKFHLTSRWNFRVEKFRYPEFHCRRFTDLKILLQGSTKFYQDKPKWTSKKLISLRKIWRIRYLFAFHLYVLHSKCIYWLKTFENTCHSNSSTCWVSVESIVKQKKWPWNMISEP